MNTTNILFNLVKLIFATFIVYSSQSYSNSIQSKNDLKIPETLKVCTAGGFIPFTYISNGNWFGFDIHMMKAFSKHLNSELEILNYSIDGIIPALNAKKCDLISTGMVITEERKKSVLFSNSYFKSKIIYLFKKTNLNLDKINNVNDLNNSNYKIGVKIGTTNDFYAAKNLNKANIFKYNEYGDLVNSVRIGKVDAIIIDSTYGLYLEKKFPNIFKFKETEKNEQYFGVATRLSEKELIKEFNYFLSKWKSDGEYEKVYKKFF
ncbi:ABC transporter substrate-binding protein [Silvanigrella sp.]|jgi:polar amino acid transport system substrate-binding protein|uniref:ABC transporter substrate-binding protein n=1 Tax=Silvanigrella sp. TaxID=2024976 RepID=UPI0037C75CF9